MLHACFNRLRITDRDDRIKTTAEIVGRDITSSNQLTKDEASKVIDVLAALAGTGEVIDAEIVDEPETLI
jgi:hypothetical protein